MPLTMEEVYGKVLKGKAVIVDGEMEILPGVIGFTRPFAPIPRAPNCSKYRLVLASWYSAPMPSHPRRLFGTGWSRMCSRPIGAAIPGLREVLQDHRRL